MVLFRPFPEVSGSSEAGAGVGVGWKRGVPRGCNRAACGEENYFAYFSGFVGFEAQNEAIVRW